MQADKQTRDLKRSCLRLKDGLIFVPQQHREEIFYHIEDSARARFFRVGYAQYVFISLLDGKTSFSAALALTARQLGPSALTEQDATQLSFWLLRQELASFADSSKNHQKLAGDPGAKPSQLLNRINPFWLKLPLGSPDRMFSLALPACRWLFHPLTILTMLGVIGVGLMTLLQHWDRFSGSLPEIFAPQNWIWMLICWTLLKIVHEFAHGIVCKYYGGEVKDTGLIFILFAPMAYVDVTPTWRFSSKWQRIAVASAGMLVELVIASIAILAWSRTSSDITASILHHVVLMAGLSTLLFNANPLMRFDGYFILSDLIEIPNLYEEGATKVRQMMAWLFLGQSTRDYASVHQLNYDLPLRLYGIATSVWKLVVGVTLMIGASTMFHGAGIVLGVIGMLMWFGLPIQRALRTLGNQFYESRPAFFRAILVSQACLLFAWWAWAWSPCPASLRIPCLVDYRHASFVRANTSGFLAEVLVEDAAFVKTGTPLVRLANKELEVDVQRLISEFNQSQQRARIARDEGKPAAVQIEREKQRSINEELSDKQTQLASLLVTARRDGCVVLGGLNRQIGTYFTKGDDLLVIGRENLKECVISVSQDDLQDVIAKVGQEVRLRVGSRSPIRGKLKRIEPRASTRLPHVAFAASMGGNIPVRKSDESADTRLDETDLEFAEPRFSGIVALAPNDAQELACGETGYAQLGFRSESMGRWVVRYLQDFFEQRTVADN